jgi:hypothetical protein
MPASKARKLSQLMSQGGSLSDIGISGVTIIGSPEQFPATNTATDGDIVLVTDINKLFVFNGSGWDSVSMVQNQSPAIITPIADQIFATGDTAFTVQLPATDPEGLLLTWGIFESDSNQNICTIQLNQSNLVSQYSTLTITPTSDVNVVDSSFNVTVVAYDNSGNSSSDIFQVELRNAATSAQLWRLYANGLSNHSNNLWDIESAGGLYTANSTRLAATMSYRNTGILQAGEYGIYGPNVNPFTQNVRTSLGQIDAGPAAMFNGSRSSWHGQIGDYIAFYLSSSLNFSDFSGGSLNLRTFSGGRPDRVPPSIYLQYYNGSLGSTYDVNKWETYATLTHAQTVGDPTWSNITQGSTIAV